MKIQIGKIIIFGNASQPKYLKTTCDSIYHHCTSYSHTLTKYSILKGSDVQLIKQWGVLTPLAPVLKHCKQSSSANGRIPTYLHSHSYTHTNKYMQKKQTPKTQGLRYFQFYIREEQSSPQLFEEKTELTVTFFNYLT